MAHIVNWQDKQNLINIISISTTVTEALRRLGISTHGNNYKTFKKYIKKYNISTEHFGLKHDTVVKLNKEKAIPLKEIFEGKHPNIHNYIIKKKLLAAGIKTNKCEICGQNEKWNGLHLIMQLDHVNGISTDHRLENLRLICPNCHTQTSTYCGKNNKLAGKGKYRKKYKDRKEYYQKTKQNYKEEQSKYIDIVLNSDIDFSKFGWVSKVAKIINQKPQKISKWMKNIMPEFYKNKCYKRKQIS